MQKAFDYSYHIALSTVPSKRENEFLTDIQNKFYKKYKDSLRENFFHSTAAEAEIFKKSDVLEPIKFFAVGAFDVMFLSKINSLSILQRTFSKFESIEGDSEYSQPNCSKYQTISGILLNETENCNFLSSPQSNNFISIFNLKVNNKLLIGSGFLIIDHINKYISKIIIAKKGIQFFLLQSFSWHELTFVIFHNKVNDLNSILGKLRDLTVKDFKKKLKIDLIGYPGINEESHIFIDTHTYFGINYEKFNANTADIEVGLKKELIKTHSFIDWQIKPGHFNKVINYIIKNKIAGKQSISHKLILGKSDYLIGANNASTDLMFNYRLNNAIKNDSKIFNHIRTIKTKILFDYKVASVNNVESNDGIVTEATMSLRKKMNEMVTPIKFEEINQQLKKIRLSKHTRYKIQKIIHNFLLSINDPILSIYFSDFIIYINEVIKEIDESCANDDYKLNIEKRLGDKIESFEKSFNLRTLNSYQFEDINDLDFEFNTSIQLLLSTYSSLGLSVSNDFYKKYNFFPVIKINLKDTFSNHDAINFNLTHILNPELAFYTISKEVANSIIHYSKNKEVRDIYKVVKPKFDNYFNNYSEFSKELVLNKRIDFDYYIIDLIRIYHTCNNELKLYYKWSWSYLLQNSGLYDNTGTLKEDSFIFELFRMLFVIKFIQTTTGGNSNEINWECPLPELQHFWHRYFNLLKMIVDDFFDENNKESFFKNDIEIMISHFTNKINEQQGYVERGNLNSADSIREKNFNEFYVNNKKKILDGELIYLDKNEMKNKNEFMNKYIYCYLKLLSTDLNDDKFGFIQRNWEDGTVLKNTNIKGVEMFQYSDQIGGMFFTKIEFQKLYHKIVCGAIKTLINFNYHLKREFFDEYKINNN